MFLLVSPEIDGNQVIWKIVINSKDLVIASHLMQHAAHYDMIQASGKLIFKSFKRKVRSVDYECVILWENNPLSFLSIIFFLFEFV